MKQRMVTMIVRVQFLLIFILLALSLIYLLLFDNALGIFILFVVLVLLIIDTTLLDRYAYERKGNRCIGVGSLE